MSDGQDPGLPEEHHRHAAPPPEGAGKRTLLIVLVVVLALVIAGLLLWIFVFSKGGGGAPTNPPTSIAPTNTPTQTVTPPPLAVCAGDQLSLSLGQPEGAAGSTTVPVVIGNTGSSECMLEGFPSVSFLWEDGDPTGAPSTDDSTATPQQVLLGPGNEAGRFMLTITDAANECESPLSTIGFRVTLPGIGNPIDVDNTDYTACGDPSISLLVAGPIEEGGSG